MPYLGWWEGAGRPDPLRGRARSSAPAASGGSSSPSNASSKTQTETSGKTSDHKLGALAIAHVGLYLMGRRCSNSDAEHLEPALPRVAASNQSNSLHAGSSGVAKTLPTSLEVG